MQPSSAYDLLDQRLTLLHSLAASLERARIAVLRSDPEPLRHETRNQQEICAQLRQMAAPMLPWPSLPGAERTLRVKEEVQRVEIQVARLNLAYGALLRRARRTVDIFCRVLASSAVTYTPPRPSSPVAREGRS